MRLYPRYTTEVKAIDPWRDQYYVVDHIGRTEGHPTVVCVKKTALEAQTLAHRLERIWCEECGTEPRAQGTYLCVMCYVNRRM